MSSRRRSTRRGRAWGGLLALLAIGVLCAAGLAIPGTSSTFVASVRNVTNRATSASYTTCAGYFAADVGTARPSFEYALTDPSGSTTASDSSGNGMPGVYQGTMTSTSTAPIACPGDAGGTWLLDGTSNYLYAPNSGAQGPTTFSVEIWFKTTVAAGKLIGWGALQTGASPRYDRHLYITSGGKVAFGAYNGATQVLQTSSAYTDGTWHFAVGTMSESRGMCLYIDGSLSSCNTSWTTAEGGAGYWRVGYDNLTGWPDSPGSYYFNGSLRFAAAYNSVLSAGEINWQYKAGLPT